MTFYQFIQRELEKHSVQCSETENFFIYKFARSEYPYSAAFPKPETVNFAYYYGEAIKAAALIEGPTQKQGLATIAQKYDQENDNAQNENQNRIWVQNRRDRISFFVG